MAPFSSDNLEAGDVKFEDGPIIVGGASGLATAACLKQKGLSSLILEKADCIPSLWKYKTYDRIHLHLPNRFCELPLLSMDHNCADPLTFSQYVDHLERYALQFQLSPRFNETVISANYDDNSGLWKVSMVNCERGNFRIFETYSTRWLIVASGENAEPQVPWIEGVNKFKGNVLHSCAYKNGANFKDSNVLIVGCGNSGMEIALDLAYFGAKPSLVLRGYEETPFQQNREEEEAKKKRADDEAARLYEEFVKSLKTDDVPSGKAFVRGETIDPNERLKTGNQGGSLKKGSR